MQLAGPPTKHSPEQPSANIKHQYVPATRNKTLNKKCSREEEAEIGKVSRLSSDRPPVPGHTISTLIDICDRRTLQLCFVCDARSFLAVHASSKLHCLCELQIACVDASGHLSLQPITFPLLFMISSRHLQSVPPTLCTHPSLPPCSFSLTWNRWKDSITNRRSSDQRSDIWGPHLGPREGPKSWTKPYLV